MKFVFVRYNAENEWGRVGTLQETINLIMQYRGIKRRPALEKGFRAWFRRWIFQPLRRHHTIPTAAAGP